MVVLYCLQGEYDADRGLENSRHHLFKEKTSYEVSN